MSWIKTNGPYFLLILLGIWVLIFTIYDILLDKGWQWILIGAYIVLIFLLIIVTIIRTMKRPKPMGTVEEFEKTLKGGLFHFKCPTCEGIFALKKSKSNDEKPVKMTCPDCGSIGIIPPHPKSIEGEIPEKKSIKANFKCITCGEGITVWAEGSDLYPNTCVFACPFCGKDEMLNRF
jgi:DNA-directed RNA polymerase subunit RPC12/RpoP